MSDSIANNTRARIRQRLEARVNTAPVIQIPSIPQIPPTSQIRIPQIHVPPIPLLPQGIFNRPSLAINRAQQAAQNWSRIRRISMRVSQPMHGQNLTRIQNEQRMLQPQLNQIPEDQPGPSSRSQSRHRSPLANSSNSAVNSDRRSESTNRPEGMIRIMRVTRRERRPRIVVTNGLRNNAIPNRPQKVKKQVPPKRVDLLGEDFVIKTLAGNRLADCSVCWERPSSTMFNPCGHVCMCQECFPTLKSSINDPFINAMTGQTNAPTCPICREIIDETIPIMPIEPPKSKKRPSAGQEVINRGTYENCWSCSHKRIDTAFYECGHSYLCQDCAGKINIGAHDGEHQKNSYRCLICSKKAKKSLNLYFA